MKKATESTFTFQDLSVWQKAIDFATAVILAVEELDTNRRHFRLIEQLEAASTSVSMNIAEGKGRHSRKEFVQYLYIARGSLFETITLLIIFQKAGWMTSAKVHELQQHAEEITKMINSLIRSIRKSEK